MRRLDLVEVARYGAVTVGSQTFLFAGTFALVELLGVRPQPAYVLVLTLTYLGVYLASARFVFRVTPTWNNARRFLVWLGVFWLLNLATFSLFYQVLSLPYVLAMVLNILILGPVRYFANKHLVYAPPPGAYHPKP
jgi:putative flippase GtrA